MRRHASLLAACFAIAAIGPTLAADPAPATTPNWISAARVTVPELRRYDGVIEAEQRSTVSAEVSARIEALPFDVDDFVAQGDVIVRFRDEQAQAGRRQAEAAVAEAEAHLVEARSTETRVRSVFERGTLSQADLDAAVTGRRAAEARLSAAEASLASATERFEHTLVRAPYSGIVVTRHVEVGEMASVGQPLMTGLSLEHLRVVVDVPQSAISALRDYGRAAIELPDGSTLESDALRIFPYADPATHTFRVRVGLPEGSHGIFPGMLVKVHFQAGETEVLEVPLAAIVRRSEVTAVYVLGDDELPRLRQVLLGRERGDRVSILSGLSEGERVVVMPPAPISSDPASSDPVDDDG